MTIIRPADATFGGARQYAARAPIQATDWADLAEATHYMFERRGVLLGGRIFDPVRTTDIADTFLCGVPTRLLRGGGVSFDFLAFGKDGDLTFTVKNLDTGATLSTTVLALNASTTRWASTTETYTGAEIRDTGTTGGQITLLFVEVTSALDPTGEVYQIGAYGSPSLSDAQMPITP